jgi:hypothetical protein
MIGRANRCQTGAAATGQQRQAADHSQQSSW